MVISDGARVVITATDYHTAGEPFRIVTGGVPEVAGSSVADRRQTAIASAEVQWARRLLCSEPRGHVGMYGCFLVPPDDAGADLGVLFWHKDGFSTACGHGIIALAAWAVESGRLPAVADGPTGIVIDVPSGRVSATVHRTDSRITAVTFQNVPSFVLHRQIPVTTARGQVTVDVSFGGATYASLPAASVGLSVVPDQVAALTEIGREIKWAVEKSGLADHPTNDRLSGCYGTILYDDLGDTTDGPHQRNITVFADGEVDRSPCGSGTSARLTLLEADGRLAPGQTLTHDSVIGTRFTGEVLGRARVDGVSGGGVLTGVTGTAHRTGEHRFMVDPADELGAGFLL